MNDLDHAATRAALLETEVAALTAEVTALRTQLAERSMGGSGSGAVVLAEVPADWYVTKRQGRTEIVRPDGNGGSVVVMVKRLTLPAVWAIFEAALTYHTDPEG